MAALSIIFPTLNAAGYLRGSLPPLAAFDAVDLIQEVIFADGGSNDDTAAIAAAAGASLVTADAGRSGKLAAGARAATGDWLLFLHADTRLDADWNAAVRDVLVAEQVTKGSNIGSWDPKGPWGPYGGRVYSTAMAALCLEVYARYLPLYQIGDRDASRTRR